MNGNNSKLVSIYNHLYRSNLFPRHRPDDLFVCLLVARGTDSVLGIHIVLPLWMMRWWPICCEMSYKVRNNFNFHIELISVIKEKIR